MTQFFVALERQLVALSMEAPRMTPRARARRRLAVGTVTVLSLFALVAGASVLPRLYRGAQPGRAPLFAGLRPLLPATSATREVSMSSGASAFDGSDGAIDERNCGHQVAVGSTGTGGVMRDVDDTSGEVQGLVCMIWSKAEARRTSKRGTGICSKESAPHAGGGVDRRIRERRAVSRLLGRSLLDEGAEQRPITGMPCLAGRLLHEGP